MATRKKAAKRAPAKRRSRKVDFDDQDAVLEEVAKHLDIDTDDLDIVTNTGLERFGAGDVYEVRIKRSPNGKTWSVVENHDAMYALAVKVVTQDLEEEPGNFSKDFIEQHINKDRLRRDLKSDVQNMAEEDLQELSDDQFWQTAERYTDIDVKSSRDDCTSDVADAMAEERLRDPMEYLEEMYSPSEAVEKAIEIAGIDVEAAADDAVDTDGAEHFLARYDNNYYTTPSGFVYWRDN